MSIVLKNFYSVDRHYIVSVSRVDAPKNRGYHSLTDGVVVPQNSSGYPWLHNFKLPLYLSINTLPYLNSLHLISVQFKYLCCHFIQHVASHYSYIVCNNTPIYFLLKMFPPFPRTALQLESALQI